MSPSILYVGFIFLAHALKLLYTPRPILTFGEFTKAFAHVNGITGETAGLAVDVQNYLSLSGSAAQRFSPVKTDATGSTLWQGLQGQDYDYRDRTGGNENVTGFGTWSNSDATLKLFVKETLFDNTRHEFSFTVVNPAETQEAVAVSVRGVGIPITSGYAFHTMRVDASRFRVKQIGQSTKYPCDENTISLTLINSVPLFRTCAPSMTISGLTGTMQPVSGNLKLDFTDSNTLPVQDFNGTWTSQTGTITIDVIRLLEMTGRQWIQDFSFSFKVVNQQQGQTFRPVTIKHSISNIPSDGGKGARTLSEAAEPDGGTLSDNTNLNLNASVPGDAKPLYIQDATFVVRHIQQSSPYPCDDVNAVSILLQMSVPLLTTHCRHTITIKGLKGFVTANNPSMDISPTGSSYSHVSQHGSEATGYVDGVFGGGIGDWNSAAGTLVLNVTSNMVAGRNYKVAMILHNPEQYKVSGFDPLQVIADPVQSQWESFDDPSISGTSLQSTATLSAYQAYQFQGNELRPGYVRSIGFVLNIVNQSKPFPCAQNTINVGLSLNVPLLRTCQWDVNHYNNTPTVSISGLTGSNSEDNTVVINGDQPFASSTQMSWTRSTGTLSIIPAQETVAGQRYDFTFTVVNKAEGQAAPTVSMGVTSTAQLSAQTQTAHRDGSISYLHAHHTSGAFLIEEEVKPMFIRSAGFFSQSSVRQTTSHPCADNTISVTLVLNVPLYARCGTNITLSGLTGMATQDSLVSSACATNDCSHTALRFMGWHQSSGTLIVNAGGSDVDDAPNGINTISFKYSVENPSTGQNAPSLSITASFNDSLTGDNDGAWVDGWDDANNAVEGQTYWITTQTSNYFGAGTNASVYVSFLVRGAWTSESRHFSSIDAGESHTSEHSLPDMPSQVKLRMVPDAGNSYNAWNFYRVVAVSRRQTTSVNSPVTRTLSVHPHGVAGASKAVMSEYWLDGTATEKTWDLTAASGLTSNTADFDAGAPPSDFNYSGSAWVMSQWNTPQSILSSSTVGTDIDEPSLQSRFPGYVQTPKIEYNLAGQSSPWPCDTNTITVMLQSNVPLLQRCQPVVTVSGLKHVQGGGQNGIASGDITVKFWKGTMQDHITSPITGSVQGVFQKDDSAPGSLKINVTSLLNDVNQLSDGQDSLMFTFEVVNWYTSTDGNYRQNPNTLQLQYSLLSRNGPTNNRQDSNLVNVIGEQRAFLFETDAELTTSNANKDYTIDTSKGFQSGTGGDASSNLQVVSGDARPLYVRPSYFLVKNITQSSPYPCDDNNMITVSLASSVPLRTTGVCNPTITIAGLTGYVTPDQQQMDVTVAQTSTSSEIDNIFPNGGKWSRTGGSVVLNVSQSQVMKAGQVYEFSFTLWNPTRAEESPNDKSPTATNYAEGLTVAVNPFMMHDPASSSSSQALPYQTFDNVYTSSDVGSTATLSAYQAYQVKRYELRPGYIRKRQFLLKTVNQSKPFPCAIDNEITVGLSLNVPLLLAKCKNGAIAAAYNQTPSVTIKGLDSSESRVNYLPVSGAQPFVTQTASWNRNSGNLVVTPQSATVAGEPYYFFFNLRNPASPTSSQNPEASVSIEVDTLTQGVNDDTTLNEAAVTRVGSQAHITSANFKDLNAEQHPLFIRTPIITASFAQGSRYPCSANTIAVTMLSNVPLYANCTPTFTITGLLNTVTGNPSAMSVLALSEVSPASLAINGSTTAGQQYAQWRQSSGRLHFAITSDLTQGASHVSADGETRFSFNFTVFNWHRERVGSSLTVEASLVDPWTQGTVDFEFPNSNSESHFQNLQDPASWLHPLHLVKPAISKIFITQSSSYPCDTNTIRVDIVTNTPIFVGCEPTFTISGLEGHETNATMLPVSYFSGHSGIAANGSSSTTAQENHVFWDAGPKYQVGSTSTRLRFGVKQDIPLKYDGLLSGIPSNSASATLGFTFVITNQAGFQSPPPLTVTASYATSVLSGQQSSWATNYNSDALWQTQTNWAVEDQHGWQTQHARAVYVGDAYKCTVTVYTSVASNAQTANTVFMSFKVAGSWSNEVAVFTSSWRGGHHSATTNLTGPPTKLKLRINGNDGWNFWKIRAVVGATGTEAVVGIDHPNGLAGASASNNANYWLDGDGAHTSREWDLSTSHIPERKPLYIRQSKFLSASDRPGTGSGTQIGQSSPWPTAASTLTVTLAVNMDLLVICRPVIEISHLKGACIDAASVDLGGTDETKFSSVNASAEGFANWDARTETLSALAHGAVSISRTTSPAVESDTAYIISFNIRNPTFAQEGPDVLISLRFDQVQGQQVPHVIAPDLQTKPGGANHIYFRVGDAKALDIYPPEFMIKRVRQDNPFPGMLNKITVSLAANVDLVSPAAITISGFLVDEAIRTIPGQRLAPRGPVALTDVADATANCAITHDPSGYKCENGGAYFKATSDPSISNRGMFDDEYGRLVLNLGSTNLPAGNHIVLQFQVRNPFCGQAAVRPCVRANRIMANTCEPAYISRAMMSVETISTDNMAQTGLSGLLSSDQTEQQHGIMTAVPGALPGEALPLFTRQPRISLAQIGQSTVYPCATNTITLTIATNVPLVAALNMSATISGLRGLVAGAAVAMAGPQSGSLSINENTNVFASTGSWNLERGELIVPVIADSKAGKRYVLSFDLENPAHAQDCAQVYLDISTFCFGGPVLMTTNTSNQLTQGQCGGFSTANLEPGIPPLSHGGSPQTIANGVCPLKVVTAALHVHYVNQTSQYPCTDNVLQIILSSNVPLRNCAPHVTISGLDGTMTNTTTTLSVSISKPAASTQVAHWNESGVLTLDASSIVPTAACEVFAFSFEVKNPMQPRGKAIVTVGLNGNLNFSIAPVVMTVPSTSSTWYRALPGIPTGVTIPTVESWRDPLFVVQPAFTTHVMGQTTPFPGANNTLSLTLASNVPLTTECSTLRIINLEGACASAGSGPMMLDGPDKASFKDLVGTTAMGSYTSITDLDRSLEIGSLTLKPVSDTIPGQNYHFSFNIINPVMAQNSPGIQVLALGIPIQATLVDKDTTTVLVSPCHSVSLACRFAAGDAAPLKVFAPMFLQKDISQSMPYPLKNNVLTVTLMTNIPLTEGSLVTLSGLHGATTPNGVLSLSGTHGNKFQSGSGSATGQAYWDSDQGKLTLRVAPSGVLAGVLTVFSFNLNNSACSQQAQAVCVRASRIATSCLDCASGQCVTLTRQAMDRDFVTILGYGVKGNANYADSAYYHPDAVITYTEEPPAAGDAAPLRVYAPEFVVANITQSSPYPGANNIISATFSTNVPLIANSAITVFGLTGSMTPSNGNLPMTAGSSVFAAEGQWFQQNGSFVLPVLSETVGGAFYSFSVTLRNPNCRQDPPTIYIQGSPICLRRQQMTSFLPNTTTPAHLSGIWGVTPQEMQPLFVRPPSFLGIDVWQRNPFPAANNEIYLRFATNMDMMPGSNLTISGLVGARADRHLVVVCLHRFCPALILTF